MSLFLEKQIKIISIIVFMLLTANLNAQILADINDTIFGSYHGIMAHYPFDNSPNDISGNNHHGVLSGPVPTTNRFNNSNQAYSFSGNNQYISVADDIWSDELTLTAWAYPTDLGVTPYGQTGKCIFFKAPNTGYNQDYDLNISWLNGIPRFVFIFGQGTSSYFVLSSNTIVNTNQWYFIAVTRKNGIAKIYINGAYEKSIPYPFSLYNQHYNIKLGMTHATFQSFAGKLDDLRIYKRALCDREIKILYNNPYTLKVKIQDTLLCQFGSTFIHLINPEPGVSYQLYTYPGHIPVSPSQITYCDSILSISTGLIQNTSYFTITGTDSVTGCNNQLDSVFKISTYNISNLNLGNDTSLCIGQSITLNAGNGASTYLWNTGVTTQTISVNQIGSYWVTITNGLCSASDTISIISIDAPPIIDLGNDTLLCQGTTLTLSPGIGFTKYLWSTGSTLPQILVTEPGNYSVTVWNGNCPSSDNILLKECESEIWIPNVFTPNGDGINDEFYPVYSNIEEITLYIFNRWGNQIFEGSGINARWNGIYKGKLCPDGVYTYLINYVKKGTHAGPKEKHGCVTLLK